MEVLAERGDDLLGLALAQQAVVDEDAREPVAEGPVAEDGGDRRVDPARQAADGVVVRADARAHLRDGLLGERARRPAWAVRPATSNRNAASISAPRGVWTTSG